MNALPEPPTEELHLPEAAGPPIPERFFDLAAAVRRHELTATGGAMPKRPADHDLYRLLNTLERLD